MSTIIGAKNSVMYVTIKAGYRCEAIGHRKAARVKAGYRQWARGYGQSKANQQHNKCPKLPAFASWAVQALAFTL